MLAKVLVGRTANSLHRMARFIHVESKITALGLKMPAPAVPKGSFLNYVQSGNFVFLSGHLPQPAEGNLVVGKIGKDMTVDEGYNAAKLCGLNICSTLKHNLGDLDHVKRIVKLTGFVNCTDTFAQQPQVVNGCSDLFVKVFGEKGAHARSAIGSNALPLGVAVEVEAIVELEPNVTFGSVKPSSTPTPAVDSKPVVPNIVV